MELDQLFQALRAADARAQQGDTQAAEDARRIAQMIQRAQSAPAPQADRPSTMQDVGQAFLGGAIRGAGAIVDLPSQIGQLMGRGFERVTGADLGMGQPMPGFVESLGETFPGVGQAAGFQPETVAGGYAETAGEFLPGLVTPGGPLARIGYGVLAPAAVSETAGLTAEALGAGETGEMLARLGGAVVGPVAAERTIRGLISPTAGTAAPRVAAAETLREAGVPVTAGQQAGSGILRRIEGTGQPSGEQLEALTQAALRSIGSDASRVTDDVLNAARNRIGGVFDDVTQNLVVTVDPSEVAALQQAAATYRQLAPTTAQAPIIDNIVGAVSNPNIQPTADQLMTWRSRLSRLTTTPDAATRQAAVDALETIDDIIANSLRVAGRDADVASLNTARQQWRDYLAIERAAAQGGEAAAEGLLTPGGLRIGVQGQNRGQYVRGQRGELGDITRSAQAVLGTAPTTLPFGIRSESQLPRAVGAMLGGGAGSAAGPVGAGIGALAGSALPEIGRAVTMSAPMQAYLRNQLVGPSVSRLTPAQRALIYGPSTGFPSVFNQGGMQ